MDIYKVYCTTRRGNGVILKSDSFIVKEESKENAIVAAKKSAIMYGFRGKIHVGNIFKRDENKIYQPV